MNRLMSHFPVPLQVAGFFYKKTEARNAQPRKITSSFSESGTKQMLLIDRK